MHHGSQYLVILHQPHESRRPAADTPIMPKRYALSTYAERPNTEWWSWVSIL